MVLALQSPGPHETVRRAMPLAKLILRALSDKERANAKSQLRLLRLYAVRGGSVLNKLAEMLTSLGNDSRLRGHKLSWVMDTDPALRNVGTG